MTPWSTTGGSHQPEDGEPHLRASVGAGPLPKGPGIILGDADTETGHVSGLSYQLIIASQPYRARTSVEQKMSTVIVPLARVLAPGGRMVVVHSHGDDPGLEDQGVWPEEEPFQTNRHVLAAAASIISSSRVMRI